jgi:hypothetical protein
MPRKAESNGHHTVRVPQETVVEVVGDAHASDGDEPTLAVHTRSGYGTMLAHVLYAGRLFIIPRWQLVDQDGDVYRLVKSGRLVVRDDVAEAEIPEQVDAGDSWSRAIARDGKRPEPSEGEQRTAFRQKYGSWSLGDAVYECVRAGCDESKAAAILVESYSNSFLTQTASSEPWRALATEMILAERARTAGLA